MLTSHQTKTITTCITLAIFVSISFTGRYAHADNQPLWYQYAVAGDQACNAKNYGVSQRYYLGALAELEKLAAKKQRLHLTNRQENELTVLSSCMSVAFADLPVTQSRKENHDTKNGKKTPGFDIAKALTDPSYTQKLIDQSQDDYNKKKLEIAQNVKLIDQNSLDKARRMVAVCDVLLGPESQAAQISRDVYQASQRRAADDAAHPHP